MFDVTPDDINQLNDSDLRELVGRLCEAELSHRGLSPAAVTWGGNQTAADGGLDVRVELPLGTSIEGFIPCSATGFQVKKPDMPRSEIISEMRPKDMIRPVIQELADEAGAYIIVSSTGSTADRPLRDRRNAMREALGDVTNAGQLRTDFYDRTRLATWVRLYPGLITWVKERVGRAFDGWHPYSAWNGVAENVDAEYLLDDKLRLHLSKHQDAPAQSVAQAIDELRDELIQPGKIVRLVGLSGVGKTRLAQALFDARIGTRPLPPFLAVYTNLSDNPDPQPTGLASDLIANRMRAVLIVDNCPPDLHHRLMELCSRQNSTVSVLTVEYDIRDDQPEGTHIITLETSSPELIEKLVQRRYPYLSQVDTRTIAEASGGNARIAIALAETVERTDTIAGLSNDELFRRLFWQRHIPNEALLLAAQASSLVYSFQGEAMQGEEAELPRLALLAGQNVMETYRHVIELCRRDLIQQRGDWRAVLPHAIANWLAARALQETPYDLINQQLIEGGTERLARSFSRRLSFLHEHPKAIAIVRKWLAPGGLLGDVTALNDLEQAMFQNVAPVLPEATLAVLERAGTSFLKREWHRWHLPLLRSLAYDPSLFERCAQLLARVATFGSDKESRNVASNIFASLFTICLSGTHATIEQRLAVIEGLLRSPDSTSRSLGLAALDAVLKTTHFSSGYRFEFGARSRDYGYSPKSKTDLTQWYDSALVLVDQLDQSEGVIKHELRSLVARHFRELWTLVCMQTRLETLVRKFATDGFWREGWIACRQTMQFDSGRLTPEMATQLSALEAALKPSNLADHVRGIVLGNQHSSLDLDEMKEDEEQLDSAAERLEEKAFKLGAAVATDDVLFTELLPDLLRGGSRAWVFARGLASTSPNRRATWAKLIEGLDQIASEQRSYQVPNGFLAELWEQDKALAQELLDSALDQPILQAYLPLLHSAVGLDERGVVRLKKALSSGLAPIRIYESLAWGRATSLLPASLLKDLLLIISEQHDGYHVALEILYMRFFSDNSDQKEHAPELLELGREFIQRATFQMDGASGDHRLVDIAQACLIDPASEKIITEIVTRLRHAVANGETNAFCDNELLAVLLALHPMVVLDALFTGRPEEQEAGIHVFNRLTDHRGNAADAIPNKSLITWCEIEPENRYALAASIISFADGRQASNPLVWSEQAKALLSNASNPRLVLEVFIKRFLPDRWGVSRAALLELNAHLLNSVEPHIPSSLMPFAMEAKTRLLQDAIRERESETRQDRARDERFE